jgi:uncharacterized phage protein (predicted DNA packaging)
METLISLDELKKHLNIEQGFLDEDGYLEGLICAAQEVIEQRINRRLTDCEPDSLRLAIKFYAALWYNNREGVSFGNPVKVPDTLDVLIGINRNFNGCRGITD